MVQGRVGCEALSQGAAKSIFLDMSKTSLLLAKENVSELGFTDRSDFILKDVSKIGERSSAAPSANLVFLDPPYRKGLIDPAINALRLGNWLDDNAIIVIEAEKEYSPLSNYGDVIFDKTYSETRVIFISASHG